jgi:hypothetical protein
LAGLDLQSNVVDLQQIERQKDPIFTKYLNEVRLGKLSIEFEKLLSKCLVGQKPTPTNGIIPTKLYAINKEVDAENLLRLDELTGEIVSMVAQDFWKVICCRISKFRRFQYF